MKEGIYFWLFGRGTVDGVSSINSQKVKEGRKARECFVLTGLKSINCSKADYYYDIKSIADCKHIIGIELLNPFQAHRKLYIPFLLSLPVFTLSICRIIK